jgi:hypothetical protein
MSLACNLHLLRHPLHSHTLLHLLKILVFSHNVPNVHIHRRHETLQGLIPLHLLCHVPFLHGHHVAQIPFPAVRDHLDVGHQLTLLQGAGCNGDLTEGLHLLTLHQPEAQGDYLAQLKQHPYQHPVSQHQLSLW